MEVIVEQAEQRPGKSTRPTARGQPRAQKPNYKRIHALPLPVDVHPLPTLIPHNPLSILAIFLTYLVQQISRPSSHTGRCCKGTYSAETQSIHVTDPVSIRKLWEMGFFGKGNLSRSEPSWLDKEKRRRGLLAQVTSEEVTRKRRQERKTFKNERARKEREAIEEQLLQEGKIVLCGSPSLLHATVAPYTGHRQSEADVADQSAGRLILTNENQPPDQASGASGDNGQTKSPHSDLESAGVFPASPHHNVEIDAPVKDIEHLQLTHEEALFLVYGLGVLEVCDESTQAVLPPSALLPLFRRQSYFPPYTGTSLPLDDPFMLSYVVYHHFRSLGWVVRSGIKFAADYLLYNRGPVFSHAEFAIIIVPSYDHPYYANSPANRDQTTSSRSQNWWWLHCINRVQAQVHKNLILVYVEIPAPLSGNDNGSCDDLTALLKRYRVREYSLKRWTPNRGRD